MIAGTLAFDIVELGWILMIYEFISRGDEREGEGEGGRRTE
jgi:hypothetical protein